MELNWTTFVLEIVNFLVLVWLLQRFFYKPVKEVMVKRQQNIDGQLQKARQVQQQAEELRQQYEDRMMQWENERQDARKQLQEKIDAEHLRLMSVLQQNVEAERKKNELLVARQATERKRQSDTRALALGARFVSRLLRDLASEEMQARLIEILMAELTHLPPAQRETMAAVTENGGLESARIVSAYPLDQTRQKALNHYLDTLLSRPLQYTYSHDPDLLAGVRISVGPWIIHANLQDELKTFATIAYEH